MKQVVTGCGIGLRFAHIEEVLNAKPAIPWLEVLSDNYLTEGSVHQEYLLDISSHYPLTLHGVGMSLGGVDPLNQHYLDRLKHLADKVNPLWISDHLCWSSAHGIATHDLIPLPYTRTTIDHVASRIRQAQDYLGRSLIIENVSSYLQYQDSVMPEWEFIAEVAEKADCGILLDINNIYVSSRNHDFSPETYLKSIPRHRVRQMHLAGFEDRGTHLLDTHGHPVSEPVWELFKKAQTLFGATPTLIEWDNNLPAFDVLMAEADKADQIMRSIN